MFGRATPASGAALDFDGSAGYVRFGNPAALGLAQFTLECWFKREGPGATTTTGSGGVTAVPLVTHGRGGESNPADVNYFLGIDGASAVIVADFEEGAANPGANHPVSGITPIVNGIWYHAAATYDGNEWRLYLNGVLETASTAGALPRSNTTQQVGIASAIYSTSVAQGFFNGVIDEVRIWNHARSEQQVQSAINSQLTTGTGLVARWGLDEGTGTAVVDSTGTVPNGAIQGTQGTNWSWVSGAPFDIDINLPPNAPVRNAPADGGVDSNFPTLKVSVSDPDADDLTVTFYGRQAATAAADFTVVALPDTQYYVSGLNGGTPAHFTAQTQWIVDNKDELDIEYVAQLGDCVEHGNDSGEADPDSEWKNADASLSLLENPLTTMLEDGIPYGVAVGNHDQTPAGNPTGNSTLKYNQYFGESRFLGRAYYQGHFGTNNDNHVDFFSAGGMDFIVVYFEYDTSPDADVLAWANNLLQVHGDRRAIAVAHSFLGTGNPGTFSSQGQATYDALKGNPNLFLMLCGHVCSEGRRSDTFNGNTVHTMLSDYQCDPQGGNGWLRILNFSPANSQIAVMTYSPTLDQFRTEGSSEFIVDYDMGGVGFQTIAQNVLVPSEAITTALWPNLLLNTEYEWYVSVDDGAKTTNGPVWSFTTGGTPGSTTSTSTSSTTSSTNAGATTTTNTTVTATSTTSTIDTCTPGTPSTGDATCDGIDDDCNGTADEDYQPSATSCGVGACAAAGENRCTAGSVQDTCTPGTPAPGDATCDGVDDDCDGTADENYESSATSCGVGACAANGATMCVAGAVADTCRPGTPASGDVSCNGTDDDCDGATDEDYQSSATSCGVGACAATGQIQCVSGSVHDSCTPGTPSTEVCDGLDNDCDGVTDEDFLCPSGQACNPSTGQCESIVPPTPVTLNVRVAASSNDAEERLSNGAMDLSSSDLELIQESSAQTVGMRFTGITIPRQATIVNAWVQFQTDETGTTGTTLTFWGQSSDDAGAFTSAARNISSRPKTAASVTWPQVGGWTVVGAQGDGQRTPNLAAVIQQIVDRDGWTSGNALALIVTGSGKRVAEAYDGLPSAAPLLHVEYVVSGSSTTTTTVPATTTTMAPATTTTMAPTTTTMAPPTTTTMTPTTTTMAPTTTLPSGLLTLNVRVAASANDAEEQLSNGAMDLSSSDLELIQESSAQTVGMRFTGITIPRQATIVNAWVQFQTDETGTTGTTLTFWGQSSDDAGAFTSAARNISSRPKTAASVTWPQVGGWTVVGAQGDGQRTPNLAAVIQQIVDRAGWTSGNALALIATGTGKRVAEAYDGVASAAPLLHVEYVPPSP